MTERQSQLEQGPVPHVRPAKCHHCGGAMHRATLRVPGTVDSCIFIEDDLSSDDEDDDVEYKSLDVWVCQACGYVELHALPSEAYCEQG